MMKMIVYLYNQIENELTGLIAHPVHLMSDCMPKQTSKPHKKKTDVRLNR